MTITNNLLPILDLPSWEVLQPVAANTAAGACLTNDERGTDRFIYYLLNITNFWRYDVYANTWQQLASPTAGSGTFGAGTCMIFDPSTDIIYTAGSVWLLTGYTTTCNFQRYNIATNAWTSRAAPIAGAWGTDGSLAHTCTVYNGAGDDDAIYLIGNGAIVFYKYTIAGNTWSTLTALGSAAGTGSQLMWQPGYNTGRLVYVRANGTSTFQYYDIGTPGWTTLSFNPATETYTTGTTACCRDVTTDKFFIQQTNSGKIYEADISALTLTPTVTEYLIAQGTALVGNKLCYIKDSNGIEFLYMLLNTSTSFLRTPLYF